MFAPGRYCPDLDQIHDAHKGSFPEITTMMRSRSALSRRGFCLCCIGASTITATGSWLTPGQAFAQAGGIVESMRAEAAAAPIKIHRLRGEVSVLEGSGGNIGVLTGPDGKVL
ncbi:MAG TPA: hypothetical protein VEZ12_07735, partial [Herpetosiphonaceae bacterium]|nr:hypothetical protein [Herpetosiphonaceae bacterium]